jgi:hypothetical protein
MIDVAQPLAARLLTWGEGGGCSDDDDEMVTASVCSGKVLG